MGCIDLIVGVSMMAMIESMTRVGGCRRLPEIPDEVPYVIL